MSKRLTYAYTAGLIDGEGTISLVYKYKSNPYRWPTITVPSCTKELTDFLKNQFGGCISNKRPDKVGHTPSKTWRLAGDKSLALLNLLLPYLKEPDKIRRAKLLIDKYKRLTPRNGRYTTEQRIKKLEFEHQFLEGGKTSRQTTRIRWAS
jgi:hypothetical protein